MGCGLSPPLSCLCCGQKDERTALLFDEGGWEGCWTGMGWWVVMGGG